MVRDVHEFPCSELRSVVRVQNGPDGVAVLGCHDGQGLHRKPSLQPVANGITDYPVREDTPDGAELELFSLV